MMQNKNNSARAGFTIVELLVVIIVIGILATIGFVYYSGMQERAREAVLRSDLSAAAEILNVDQVRTGSYPDDEEKADRGNGLPASADTEYQYDFNNSVIPPTFCLTGINGPVALYITQEGRIQEGVCEGHAGPIAGGDDEGTPPGGGSDEVADGIYIQEIDSENCPTERTRAVDARDNKTYWVQKLADDKCWMLTNLAYAGGGVDDYGDVKALTSGGSPTFNSPHYYVAPNANVTTEPTNPSTSTDGTGQYGYFYNWCGAMGGQATAACANASSPAPDPNTSVCPAGWRLPTGSGGETTELVASLYTGTGPTDVALRDVWLAQVAGMRFSGYTTGQGTVGSYWSSTQRSASEGYALALRLSSHAHGASYAGKDYGFSVRCTAF